MGPQDQLQSLAALKARMLGQLQAAEQRIRAAGGPSAPGAAPGEGLNATNLISLLKDSVRVVLLSLALAFDASAQRKSSGLSLRVARWRQEAKQLRKKWLRRLRRKTRRQERHPDQGQSQTRLRSCWPMPTERGARSLQL